MRHQALWFLSAAILSSSAVAESPARTWVIDAGEVYLEQAGKPRRAVTLPGWQWARQPYACAPAVATGPRGEAIVTSNVLPVLWKIDPDTLAVSVHRLELDADNDKDVGFSGLVYSERSGAYFAVSELQGSLWRIDPLLRRAQKMALAEPVRGGCLGRTVHLAPDQRSVHVVFTRGVR
jgi:hypothetical protein